LSGVAPLFRPLSDVLLHGWANRFLLILLNMIRLTMIHVLSFGVVRWIRLNDGKDGSPDIRRIGNRIGRFRDWGRPEFIRNRPGQTIFRPPRRRRPPRRPRRRGLRSPPGP